MEDWSTNKNEARDPIDLQLTFSLKSLKGFHKMYTVIPSGVEFCPFLLKCVATPQNGM